MASVSLQFISVSEAVTEIQQPAGNNTPTNANQAQGAPAPQDTVTLANQASQPQRSDREDRGGRRGQPNLFAQAERFIEQFAAAEQQNPQITTIPTIPSVNQQADAVAQAAQPATNTTPTTVGTTPSTDAGAPAAATAAATAAASATGDATPQQQLNQLDQTLQQLGVNPQSISLFNRLAMLLYANDPAALQ